MNDELLKNSNIVSNVLIIIMQLVFGTGGRFGKFNLRAAKRLIDIALENGINSYDTGFTYGNFKSQPLLSKCLEGRIRDNRKSLYLSTKCPPLSAEYISDAVQKSIETLKCGYLDCFHLWGGTIETLENKKIISLMNTLTKSKKIKTFSISTQDLRTLKKISSGNFDEIGAIMIDYNLLKQNRLPFIKKCKSNNIKIFASTALCQGLLVESIFEIYFRTFSPFYVGRALIKKESRGYLKPARKLRIYLKQNYKKNYFKIPLSFIMNEKNIDFIPIGMLSKKSIENNMSTFNNPVGKLVTKKVAHWAKNNCQAKDYV